MVNKPDKNIAQNKLLKDPHAMAEALRAKTYKPEGRLLTDGEISDIEVSVSFHNWLRSHDDIDWKSLLPLSKATCEAQDAKTASIIRAERLESKLREKITQIVCPYDGEMVCGKCSHWNRDEYRCGYPKIDQILALYPDVDAEVKKATRDTVDFYEEGHRLMIKNKDAEHRQKVGEIFEGIKLPEPKSLLADCAYTGGDIPKKWINEMGKYYEGYNKALSEVKSILDALKSRILGGKP